MGKEERFFGRTESLIIVDQGFFITELKEFSCL
jgi:hypothetical protein